MEMSVAPTQTKRGEMRNLQSSNNSFKAFNRLEISALLNNTTQEALLKWTKLLSLIPPLCLFSH